MTNNNHKNKMDALVAPMEAVHRSNVNLSYEWRVQQLKNLKKVVSKHVEEWIVALHTDLAKPNVEAVASELQMVENEINFQLKHLKKWMKPQHVPGPAFCAVSLQKVESKPLRGPGVLVIGPFNYPLHLTLVPAAGSLAGGNPTIVKPSELCPATCALMEKLVKQYMDPGALQVVQGGIPETTALLEREWGMIFFTGSERVGKIVAMAAAKTLTPVILELGGKSPVYVDETAPNLRFVAERIIWGKTFNCGQTCVAPDYLLIHKVHGERLCKELVKAVERQYGSDFHSLGLGRIVHTTHAKRHVAMLQEVEHEQKTCTILCGGSQKCNAASKFVPPTLVLNPPRHSKLLTEEIFGPILPIIVVESRQEAIEFIQQMPGIPLNINVFTTSDKVFRQVTDACRSAGSTRNDALGFQTGSPHLPAGGLGSSGYGTHHGKFSFDAFTHKYPIVYRPCGPGWECGMIRYQPFSPFKAKLVKDYLMKLPTIPVLHSRAVLTTVVLVVATKSLVPQAWVKLAADAVAGVLEGMATWLRSNQSE